MKLLSKNKSLIISSLVIMMCITGAIIVSNSVKADNPATTSATASVTVSSACSMTYNNSSAHTVSMINNSTEENVGVTTLTATCNDAGGLAIYAIGYSNDEYGNTNMIGTTGNIATGTNDSTSNWSMRLYTATGSITPSSITSTFTAVPSTYTKFAELSSGTTGSSALAVNATYRFHISATQPADTYTGKVKYTMIHPSTEVPKEGPVACAQSKICYSPNANDVVGTMGQQTVSASDTSATLLASNFSREGYGFAGWSDQSDYATNPNAHFYGPQEDITFTAGQYTGNNPGLSLYAVWVQSEGSLQDSSKVATVCSGLTQSGPNVTKTLNSVSALTDQRDNETYAIAKLADGNCWMIENLRLENTNSDNSTGTLAQGYATSTTYGSFSGLADPESPWAYNIGATNSLYSTNGSTAVTILGSNPSYRIPRYSNINTPTTPADRPQNPTSNSTTNSTSGAGLYSYGNYYTWPAALASLIGYAGPTYTVDDKTSETANTSICPKGWKLPYGRGSGNGTTSGGFAYLNVQLGGRGGYADSTTTPTGAEVSYLWRSYPNNFLYSGYVNGGSVRDLGDYCYYSSSTSYNNYNAYFMDLGSTYVGSGGGYSNKDLGWTIRCVASGS